MKPVSESPTLLNIDRLFLHMNKRLDEANMTAWFKLMAGVGFVGTGVAHLGFKREVGDNWMWMIIGFAGISVIAYGVKRKTAWTPEQIAEAEQIKNGHGHQPKKNLFGNGE